MAPSPSPGAITELLERSRGGDEPAAGLLVPLVYGELRRIAASCLRRERAGHTLQATALVHEAYLRLLKDHSLSFQNRAHFLGIAARAMREILVEHARARDATKRGGERRRITLDEAIAATRDRHVDVLAIHEALERLAALDAQHARLVELRFFGGLTNEEAAEALGVSVATIKRTWSAARAWLYRELSQG